MHGSRSRLCLIENDIDDNDYDDNDDDDNHNKDDYSSNSTHNKWPQQHMSWSTVRVPFHGKNKIF